MKHVLVSLILMCSYSVIAKGQTSDRREDGEAAAAVASKLFAAIRAKDAAGIKALFLPGGQLVAIDKPRTGNGLSTTRVLSGDAFAKLISEAKGPEFIEAMSEARVELFGDLALVFGPYTFKVGDKFSHCGTNAFQLARTPDGWKIANAASTLEFNCAENK